MVVVFVIEPLVAAKVTVYDPVTVPPFVDTNRMPVMVPPDVSVTLAGVIDTPGALFSAGEIVADKVTVPVNPLILVTLIIALPDCPLIIVSDVGLTVRPISGRVTVTLALRMFSGSTPLGTLGLLTVTQMLSLLLPEHPPGNRINEPAVAPTTL